jgi:hypothetical protein
MPRYRFRRGRQYAARVHQIRERPIENSSTSGFHLLRLEFEVFEIDDNRGTLRATGKIACRDLVIGPGVDPTLDSSIAAYVMALRVRSPYGLAQWLARSKQSVWAAVVFGDLQDPDLRNAVQRIDAFDATGWSVQEYDYDLDEDWVPVSVAADDLECSEATIRRHLVAMEAEWGEKLLRRTPGGHRRIFLPLLRNLWQK